MDTSAWYPLADGHHADHGRLAAVLEQRVLSGTRIVTTNLVVAETHALLLLRGSPRVALTFLREVGREPLVVERSTPDLEESALHDWLVRFDDQDLSFTDAVSFAVMSARGIREALTLDRHFAAAGFIMVPGGGGSGARHPEPPRTTSPRSGRKPSGG